MKIHLSKFITMFISFQRFDYSLRFNLSVSYIFSTYIRYNVLIGNNFRFVHYEFVGAIFRLIKLDTNSRMSSCDSLKFAHNVHA